MATLILVRHGRSTANTQGVLAGRLPGIALDETGGRQADRTGRRLAAVPLAGLVSSPMQRCRETSRAILAHQQRPPAEQIEDDLTECDYGTWQGRTIAELTQEPLWSVVQRHPSAAVFPEGESLAAMQARGVAAVRCHDAAVEAAHGPGAIWAAVSHGDLIKSILADALGMHLDLFQRIHVHPASVSVVRYTAAGPHLLAMNTEAGDLSWLHTTGTGGQAEVGGGAGPAATAPAGS